MKHHVINKFKILGMETPSLWGPDPVVSILNTVYNWE